MSIKEIQKRAVHNSRQEVKSKSSANPSTIHFY